MFRPFMEFSLHGKVLCQYTMLGTFAGELEATRDMLAAEQSVAPSDIQVRLVQ